MSIGSEWIFTEAGWIIRAIYSTERQASSAESPSPSGRVCFSTPSWNKHDFPVRFAFHHQLMRTSGLSQWEGGLNKGFEATFLQCGHNSRMNRLIILIVEVHNCHAPDVGVADHRVARIDFDLSATSNHDHTPELGQNRQIFAEIHVRQHLQNEIHPFPLREVHYFLQIFRGVMI